MCVWQCECFFCWPYDDIIILCKTRENREIYVVCVCVGMSLLAEETLIRSHVCVNSQVVC